MAVGRMKRKPRRKEIRTVMYNAAAMIRLVFYI